MSAVIVVENLVKEYVTLKPSRRPYPFNLLLREKVVKRAVDGISFTIREGEFVGYIGPNGAGKSTSIKVLTGVLAPTSGYVSVLGLRPHRDRIRNAQNIGVVFGQRTQLWWDLPLIDSFEILKAIYDVPDAVYKRNIEFFHDHLELGQFWETPVRQLSLGQRMRAEICAAILHNPKVLFLDEPTIGLDIVAKERIRRFLADLNREHKMTIILTTHDVGDIERLCHRLILINKGRIVCDESMDILREGGSDGTDVLVFQVAEFDVPLKISLGRVIKEEGASKWVVYNPSQANLGDVIAEVARTHRILNIRRERPSIEDIIRSLYMQGEEVQAG